ncbi:MAG: ATP-binding protein [Myxococcota bacterium]|jgi:hypothetical protein|nr:ATP-binding protein [Myxococcota bacterium]
MTQAPPAPNPEPSFTAGDDLLAWHPYSWRTRHLIRRYLLHYAGWYQVAHARQVAMPAVDDFLLRFLGGQHPDESTRQHHDRLTRELADERAARQATSPTAGLPARYESLCSRLGLDPAGADLLLLCLAERVDGELGWFLRLLADEGGAGLPRWLLEQLLDPLGEQGPAVARLFAPEAPLFRVGLLRRRGGDAQPERVSLAEPAARALRAGTPDGTDCPGWALSFWTPAACGDLAAYAEQVLRQQVTALAEIFGHGSIALLRGSRGKGADWLAAWAAARDASPLLKIHGPTLLAADPDTLQQISLEALLRRAVLLIDDWPAEEPDEPSGARLLRFFEGLHSPAVLLRVGGGGGERLLGHLQVSLAAGQVDLGIGSPAERAAWWLATCQRRAESFRASGWECLAEVQEASWQPWVTRLRVYPLGVEDMDHALSLTLARHRYAPELDAEDLLARMEDTCRGLVTHRLGELATRVTSTLTWNDVLFSPALLERFEEVRGYALHFDTLVKQWGWKRKLTSGRGLSVLLSGASGTGKTTAAALLARDLGIELFQIDLSRIVSKYIGETEERLSRLFVEAAGTGAALLFDEADSLFAGRTDVRSSVDRYANQEVNFLLERVESHPGVVFLTTNRVESFDDAFLRRIKFHLPFDEPGVRERAELWRKMIPPETPTAKNIRFHELAARFELNGGHIRNAVLRATLRAAARHEKVGMAHLVQAAGAICGELGKLVREE